MNYLICLPVVDEVATDRCFNSMPPEMQKNTIIIDNSESQFADKYKYICRVTPNQENIGVPKSWNYVLRWMMGTDDIDYVVILSATVAFNSHDSAREYIAALSEHWSEYGMETQHGWHLIAFGRATVEKIGYFDENFYPAYYEDSDYIRRMELAGIHLPMSDTQRLPFFTVGAEHHGNAHAMKAGVKVNMDACRDYFISKWDVEPRYDSQMDRDKMFKHPFGIDTLPLDYWKPATVKELKQRYDI